jgi:hypothetical protein
MDLTKEEAAWVRKMQRLLSQCPTRFGFFTTGDPGITIFDKEKEHLFDNAGEVPAEVDRHDARLGWLTFTSCVHGVRG